MSAELSERFRELIEAGRGETLGERAFVPLLTLESGMRYGLVDGDAWGVVDAGRLTVFSPASASAFVEIFEHERDAFEAQLERAAGELDLPIEAVLLSFPAVALVGAMLATSSAHYRRAALLWLLPSERRELRSAIAQVAGDTAMPVPLRELAERMLVPEA